MAQERPWATPGVALVRVTAVVLGPVKEGCIAVIFAEGSYDQYLEIIAELALYWRESLA